MGSSDPPYLYDPRPNRPISYPYSQFDPKAVSRASWQPSTTSSRPQSARDGPLIDFNRHPDSYMVVRGHQRDLPTLPANIKSSVAAVRWTQLSLRALQLLAAMATLFCGIVLKPPEQTQSWIMRITPGYDILITLYAIYHLLRSSKHRTPSSSASYHVFALLMDTALVPLYAFIAIFNNFQTAEELGSDAWSSMFPSFSNTMLFVIVCFALACSLGGLHLVSMALDLYLVVIFRKIAQMPPDMNPLEDNLTSRKSSKHKHKTSELSFNVVTDEKGSSVEAQELAVPVPKRYTYLGRSDAESHRQIPFSHSRLRPESPFLQHEPRSAHLPTQILNEINVYKQRPSVRQSALSVAGAQSFVTANSSVHDLQDYNRLERSHVKPNPANRKEILNDNWYVVNDDPADMRLDAMTATAIYGREPRLPDVDVVNDENFIHQPLAMNPPTPSVEQQEEHKHRPATRPQSQHRQALGNVPINRSSTVASNTTVASSVYSESAPSLAGTKPHSTPKKLYGDLAAAARGIRGYAKVPQGDMEVADAGQSPARVISRSGVDIADEPLVPEKSSRRRLFSGKRAEEGMAGLWR